MLRLHHTVDLEAWKQNERLTTTMRMGKTRRCSTDDARSTTIFPGTFDDLHESYGLGYGEA